LSVLQDWTKQENEDAEGVVSFSYRTKPEEPPDVQTIQKQMAIVAWQPGPNRIVQVPSQVSCNISAIFCAHQHVALPAVTSCPVPGAVNTCPMVCHLANITSPCCELDCVMGFCAQVILLSLCSSAFTKLHAQVMLALLAAVDRQRGYSYVSSQGLHCASSA